MKPIYIREENWNHIMDYVRSINETFESLLYLFSFIGIGALLLTAFSALIIVFLNYPIPSDSLVYIFLCSASGGYIGFTLIFWYKFEGFLIMGSTGRVRIVRDPMPVHEEQQNMTNSMPKIHRERKKGFVYVINSPSLPDMYKIGRSYSPHQRISKIRQRFPPFDWTIHHVIAVSDMAIAEANLLRKFANKKVGRREFFKLDEQDLNLIRSLSATELESSQKE